MRVDRHHGFYRRKHWTQIGEMQKCGRTLTCDEKKYSG